MCVNNLTREQAIERCEKAQPDRFLYNMFSYRNWDSETIFKCKSCGHRFLATPEAIWRKYRSKCPIKTCDRS